MATKRVSKKANNKFDFSDSVEAIKKSAKSVNSRMKDVTEEVTEDIVENSGQLKDMAITTVKEAYDKAYGTVVETVTVENITKTTKNINDYTLKTAEELVDGVIENGHKLQGITSKALKGGLKLASKQQDILFDTLETVKGQLTDSADRFKKLFLN